MHGADAGSGKKIVHEFTSHTWEFRNGYPAIDWRRDGKEAREDWAFISIKHACTSSMIGEGDLVCVGYDALTVSLGYHILAYTPGISLKAQTVEFARATITDYRRRGCLMI